MDYPDEQKIVIPSVKELEQIDEIDKTKVFWTVVLAIFIVGFVFVLGYWVGQQKAKTNEFSSVSPGTSIDISEFGTSPEQTTEIPYDSENNLDALDKSVPDSQKVTPSTNIVPPDLSAESPDSPMTAITPPSIERAPAPVRIVPKVTRAQVPKVKGKWALRLASVRSQANAQALKKKVTRMGYNNVNIIKIGVLYRISVLGFQTQAQVKDFQRKVEQKFNLTDTMIIKL